MHHNQHLFVLLNFLFQSILDLFQIIAVRVHLHISEFPEHLELNGIVELANQLLKDLVTQVKWSIVLVPYFLVKNLYLHWIQRYMFSLEYVLDHYHRSDKLLLAIAG